MSSNGSLGDITLRDLGKGLRRYQPFVLAVAAIVLVGVFLPGKATKTTDGGLAAGANGSTRGAGTAAGQTTGAAAGRTGGAGAAAGTAGGAGGSAQGGSAASGGLANGSVLGSTSAPAATSDPWCDPATGR